MNDLSKYFLEMKEKYGSDVCDALTELYSIYDDGMYKWFAGLWDGKIGGFYYSNSARDTDGYLPDIESTSQALSTLMSLGIMRGEDPIPPAMKAKLAAFVKNLQDPTDGYFYHPQWKEMMLAAPMKYTSRRARDMNYGLSILASCGEKPLYPSALDRINAATNSGSTEEAGSTVPEHLRSAKAFKEYLYSMDINSASYSVGSRIGQQVNEINAAGLTDVCVDYFNATQKENGLWEDRVSIASVNGLMKISCAYVGLHRPIPRMIQCFEAALEVGMSDEPIGAITGVFNPPFSIQNLFATMNSLGDTESAAICRKRAIECAPALLRRTKIRVEQFKKPDGSFSYCTDHSSAYSQSVPAGLGLNEGDINATTLANSSRGRMLRAIGIETAVLFSEEDSRDFFARIGE